VPGRPGRAGPPGEGTHRGPVPYLSLFQRLRRCWKPALARAGQGCRRVCPFSRRIRRAGSTDVRLGGQFETGTDLTDRPTLGLRPW